MKQLIKTGIISFLVLVLGLFIWTILPNAKIENTFSIDPDLSLFSEKIQCVYVQDLLRAKYIVNYPKTIHHDSLGEILVTIEKFDLNESKINIDNVVESCGILLEVWIDGKEMLVEPGSRIIEPYLNKQSQDFRFKIIPAADQLTKGTIWINAVFPNDKNAGLERIPLFAIPFTTQIQSLFGISARLIRFLSFTLTLLAMVLLYLQKDLDKKRK
jgi:hypothetical protein